MFNATPFAFSDTPLNCKSAIFSSRVIAKLQFCRFPAIFSFPTVYSYRSGNREHEKTQRPEIFRTDRTRVSRWKDSGRFLLPEFCKGVKHHICRLQKNQKPRHSPRGRRTLWAGYNALLRNICKAARYTPTWYIQRPFCDRKQGCFLFRIILFRIVPIVHHPVLSEIINSLYQTVGIHRIR